MHDDDVQKTWERSRNIGSPNYYFRRQLLQKLIPTEGSGLRALDAGCSTGGTTSLLLERGYRVDGIDLSRYAVERVKETLPSNLRSRFIGLVEDLSEFHPDLDYDLIVLSEVLEHLQDDLGILQRVPNWLAPGGSVIITVPADPRLWSEADEFSQHYRRYTTEALLTLLEKAGLKPTYFWGYGFPVLRAYTELRNYLLKGKRLELVTHISEGSMMEGALRITSSIIKILVNLDRLFIGHGKPVGLITLATRQ